MPTAPLRSISPACTPEHVNKQYDPTVQKSVKASHQTSLVEEKCVSGTRLGPQKQRRRDRERGVVATTRMKRIIRDVPGCFIGLRQPKILENIAELSLCVCVCAMGGGAESGLFELWVNASKMAELAYLHQGSARDGLQSAFYVTRLTASSGGGFEGSLSLAGLGLRLTQLWVYKGNGCQTSKCAPVSRNKQQSRGLRSPQLAETEWEVSILWKHMVSGSKLMCNLISFQRNSSSFKHIQDKHHCRDSELHDHDEPFFWCLCKHHNEIHFVKSDSSPILWCLPSRAPNNLIYFVPLYLSKCRGNEGKTKDSIHGVQQKKADYCKTNPINALKQVNQFLGLSHLWNVNVCVKDLFFTTNRKRSIHVLYLVAPIIYYFMIKCL